MAVLLADADGLVTDADGEEDVPEPPAEPVTRTDDIWTISASGHKIICGDARDRDVVHRLFGDAHADLCITSPPYSDQREYTGEMRGVPWLDLMRGAFAALPANDETQVFVNLGLVHRSNEWIPYWEPWIEYMRSIGWRRFGWYVWDQGPGLPGDWNGRLAPAFEFIFHFNRKSIHPNKTKDCKHAGDSHGPSGLRGTDGQVGGWCHQDRSIQDNKIPDSVIRVMRHKGAIAGGQHPAVLAVGMVEELILAYTKPNALIFDPFLGSASVTIAALKTGRRAYGTEISPAYCDVGLRRMMSLTGEAPVLQETGQTFAEVAQSRGVSGGPTGIVQPDETEGGITMNIRIDIQVERCPIDRLIPRITNPRTHTDEQVSQIAASMRVFHWTNPILVGPDFDVIAGHARLDAARLNGMTEVPVIVLRHLTEAQRRALVIADNQLALNAGWNEESLRLELQALQEAEFDLSLVGFDNEELARLLAAQDATTGLTDEDSVPDVPEAPISVVGDLWKLGPHTLLVGDATSEADVARLMNGAAADIVFTDLPYNVSYEGYTEDHLTIQGDRMSDADFKQFLACAFHSYRCIVKPGASLYVCHPSSWQREFQNAMEAAGFEIRCQIIWAKNTFAWGFGRYKFQHEPIFNAHVAGQTDAWYGDKSQSTLWEENKPAANRLHPTMKPVGLIERALLNSSKPGDICADFFGGAGSTLIGCERRGRAARLMELDPRYADVICRRYQEYVGRPATLEGRGRTFTEIAQERHREAA